MSEDNHKVDFSQKSLVEKLIWIMSQVERIPKNGYNAFVLKMSGAFGQLSEDEVEKMKV